jgi:hypothetical protein
MRRAQINNSFYKSIIVAVILCIPSVHGAIGLVGTAANKTVSYLEIRFKEGFNRINNKFPGSRIT